MARSRPYSCAWTRHLHLSDVRPWELSPQERKGLEWAQAIEARDEERVRAMLDHEAVLPPKLTFDDLADEVSPETVRLYIGRARRAFFGALSYSGLYSRKARSRARNGTCAACGALLPERPRDQRGPRPIYCAEHGAGAARTARSRGRPLTPEALGRPLTPEEEHIARKLRGMHGIRQPDGTVKRART